MKFLLALVTSVFVMGGAVFARETTSAEMQANFKACTERSAYWTQRWGQYVAAFDRDGAQSVCLKEYGNNGFTLKTMGCRLDGSWKLAGYYCEEFSPGGE